jgi:hypothetical protein
MGWSGEAILPRFGTLSRVLHAGAMALVILSFTIRIAFPPGFMPGSSANGLTIAICTGLGLSTIEIGPDGKPVAPSKTSHHTPCVFASVGATMSAVTPGLIALAIAYILIAGFRTLTPYLMAFRTGNTPPLRAPPAALHA